MILERTEEIREVTEVSFLIIDARPSAHKRRTTIGTISPVTAVYRIDKHAATHRPKVDETNILTHIANRSQLAMQTPIVICVAIRFSEREIRHIIRMD